MPLWSSEIAYISASQIQSHRIWGLILALSLFIVQKKCRNYWNMYTRTTAFTLRIPQWGQSYRKLQIQRLSMWLFYPEGGLFPLRGGRKQGQAGRALKPWGRTKTHERKGLRLQYGPDAVSTRWMELLVQGLPASLIWGKRGPASAPLPCPMSLTGWDRSMNVVRVSKLWQLEAVYWPHGLWQSPLEGEASGTSVAATGGIAC